MPIILNPIDSKELKLDKSAHSKNKYYACTDNSNEMQKNFTCKKNRVPHRRGLKVAYYFTTERDFMRQLRFQIPFPFRNAGI